MSTHRRLLSFFSILVIITMLFSGVFLPSASAQGPDGIERQLNTQTGKVSFISSEDGQALPAADVLGDARPPQDPAMALATRFGPEFGLKDVQRDLQELTSDRAEDGRLTVRYRQSYQGIPVIAGELIVNTNDSGDLYSMNGEVSPNLALSTQPTIDAATAGQTALQAAAKWYEKPAKDFIVSEPELWIYDESLLHPGNRAAELVWRMEVTPKDVGMAVRELVLVNAQRGSISLHFNQVDTAWKISDRASSEYSPALLGGTWYVATTGNDANSCLSTDSPCGTINGAMGKAAEGDTIMVAAGTYPGTGIAVVSINKSITLSGGWNAGFTTQNGMSTIDGQGARWGIITSGNPVVIDRFKIQNGYAQLDLGFGAGIINSGTLTLRNSIVSDNVSDSRGGGIFNQQSTLVIENTIISNNLAGAASCGGGGGGGIDNVGGDVTLNNSTVSGNTVQCYQGAGIYNSSGGSVTLNGSTVSGNFGDVAIYDISQGSLILNNSTVSNNVLGGIEKIEGHLTANNSTITANEYGISLDLAASATIQNTILASNANFNCFGNVSSAGYNLLGNNFNCTFAATTGDKVGTTLNPIDPLLKPLQENGGPTATHALLSISPAVNAGNPAAPGSGGTACLATDQRGVVRPVGGRCDIGAYEGSIAWTFTPRVSTYTANNGFSLPGTFVCNQTNPNCSTGDSHAKAAHKYAIGSYNLYAMQHGRNSIDNRGMTIISTVHFYQGYANAFWTGKQMVYGDAYGFPLADDVVAHELTHGVTQYGSNLFYYYQSGAINESFSDLWGEYYDQTNGQGNDGSGAKWMMGEDVSGSGAIRSMNEPTWFGDPDKMSSIYYYEGEADNGGVHFNSGVNNKAVYLMVDGDSFNGKTVKGLGWTKTAAIYYEANSKLLSSGADYSDLYYALQKACSSLVGQKGITTADCVEVKDALDAVEMNGQPATSFNTDAPLCAAGSLPSIVLADDLEKGTSKWTFKNGAYPRWQLDSAYYGPYAQSGKHSLYADDYPGTVTDATARLAAVTIPQNAFLHFAHAYDFETGYYSGALRNFDGGVLEYSTNGGVSWVDAGSLINFNKYKGKVFTGSGNPLSGRSAFVGSSHGYISTRLNLASLAGKKVSFRWRMGLDMSVYDLGWWVDNVKVYTCVPVPVAFNKLVPSNGSTGVDLNTTLSWNSSTYAASYQYCYDAIDDNKCNRAWVTVTSPSADISNLGANTTYYWQVRALNKVATVEADNKTWGSFTTTSTLPEGTANIETFINGTPQGSYSLGSGLGLHESYTGVNSGPVMIRSANSIPMIASERVIYKVNNVPTSFSEMMAMPASQLDTMYWLPWYNNKDLNTQLRFANVSDTDATIHVSIGGVEMEGSPYILAPGASIRKSYVGVDKGPVKIESNVNIVAAERVIYTVNGVATSYSEIMALPNKQLDMIYWLPWYNNKDLNSQLRFANVSAANATVHVSIGGVEMTGSPFILAPGASKRLSFPGVDKGPVKIESDVNIVASERVIYSFNGVETSFTETMAVPAGQLDTLYWMPWYNNKDLDTQLRFANVSDQTATVSVTIGGVEMEGSPFVLAPGASIRRSFVGIDQGPVKIESDQPIVAAERLIYKVSGVPTSFSEMMGLPDHLMDTVYWLPWYNNVELSAQLRFAIP